jgi:ferritin
MYTMRISVGFGTDPDQRVLDASLPLARELGRHPGTLRNREPTMDKAVQDALNQQIGKEFYAAYLYLAMSAHFELGSLLGFAKWMRHQAEEELGHAMRLFDYMNRRSAAVVLEAVDAPPKDFGRPLEAFETALAHERKVTELIHHLYDLAVEKHDHATQLELQWFVTEQVEEEDSIGTIVDQLRMAGDNQAALLILDRDLAARSTAD